MPNHYHLVLRWSVGTELSDLMKKIGYRYSVMHKAKYGGYGTYCGRIGSGPA